LSAVRIYEKVSTHISLTEFRLRSGCGSLRCGSTNGSTRRVPGRGFGISCHPWAHAGYAWALAEDRPMESNVLHHLADYVHAALEAAFSELIRANPTQNFYAFALFTDDSLQFIHAAANTEEALTGEEKGTGPLLTKLVRGATVDRSCPERIEQLPVEWYSMF
jgi:hypothetical protein